MAYREMCDFVSQMNLVAELGFYQPHDSQQNNGFTLRATQS